VIQTPLNQVLDIGGAGKPSATTHDLTDARRDSPQELQVRVATSFLRRTHQLCKLLVGRHGSSLRQRHPA
jgi:hypothetical protein